MEYRQSIASNNLDDHLFGNTFYSLYNYKGSKKEIKAYKYDHEEERMTLYLIVKNGVSICLREEEEIEEKKEVDRVNKRERIYTNENDERRKSKK